MRNLKNKKGITLVALVITIVVLLILAMITIKAFSDNGIIGKAQDAKNNYTKEQSNEEGTIDYYSAVLNNNLGKWTQEGDTLTCTTTNGKTTLKIGDYVDYKEGTGYTYTPDTKKGAGTSYIGGLQTSAISTEDLSWRVLGLDENGRVELISTNSTTAELTLYGIEGYKNAETVLNEMCNTLYGKGTGAESARSINVEDINKITGYTPEHQTVSITSEDKYYYDGNTNSLNDTSSGTYNGTYGLATALGITDGSPVTGNAFYRYNVSSCIDSNSAIYKLLFRNVEDTKSSSYWLSSRCVGANYYDCTFRVRKVLSVGVSDGVLYYNYSGASDDRLAVRPVVTLASNISLEASGTANTWNIVQK